MKLVFKVASSVIPLTILEKSFSEWNSFHSKLEDLKVLLEMAIDANDEETFKEVKSEIKIVQKIGESLELKRVLSGELDTNNTYISINSGAGGTESCDWAGMLLRMYQMWAKKNGYEARTLDYQDGEGAGVKQATMEVDGEFAFGMLKGENGVHRFHERPAEKNLIVQNRTKDLGLFLQEHDWIIESIA